LEEAIVDRPPWQILYRVATKEVRQSWAAHFIGLIITITKLEEY